MKTRNAQIGDRTVEKLKEIITLKVTRVFTCRGREGAKGEMWGGGASEGPGKVLLHCLVMKTQLPHTSI
jgi:hypothetical protein